MVNLVQFPSPQKARSRGRGFITVEILIALALLVVSLSSMVILGFGSQSLSVDSSTSDEALNLAIEQLDAARITPFNSIVSTSTITGIYTKELIVKNYDCLKHVTSTLTWLRDNRPQFVTLDTYVSNPPEAFRFGGDCRIGFPNFWTNPGTYDSADIHPGGNNGTDIDMQRVNGTRYVFLSSHHSSEENSDLWIYDLSQLNNPILVNSSDTGEGLFALDSAKIGSNYYVFAAQNDSNNQLQIINVTNPASPTIIAEQKLQGVGNPNPEGWSIRFYENYIYVGTRQTNGDELQIYDVSVPSNPSLAGKYSVNQDVQDIQVRNENINGVTMTIAYLGLSGVGTTKEIQILDVTNPSSITKLTDINLPGNETVNTISLSGNRMYLGRDRSSSYQELYVYDISSPSSPILLGSSDVDLNSNSGVTNILVLKNFLFMGTNDPNDEFQVWDVVNPANLIRYSTFNFPQEITGLDYVDDIVVVSVKSNDAFHSIYDQDNPPQ